MFHKNKKINVVWTKNSCDLFKMIPDTLTNDTRKNVAWTNVTLGNKIEKRKVFWNISPDSTLFGVTDA